MIRKAKAVWQGTGRDGTGQLTTDSGVLDNTTYSFKTRFENEKGTNPEELIAAAHAGCFTMALAFGLQGACYTPTELSTEAAGLTGPSRNPSACRHTLTLWSPTAPMAGGDKCIAPETHPKSLLSLKVRQ